MMLNEDIYRVVVIDENREETYFEYGGSNLDEKPN